MGVWGEILGDKGDVRGVVRNGMRPHGARRTLPILQPTALRLDVKRRRACLPRRASRRVTPGRKHVSRAFRAHSVPDGGGGVGFEMPCRAHRAQTLALGLAWKARKV